MVLSKNIYFLIATLPKSEQYALSLQMRRAVVSIPSNIAEGNQRHTTKEYINFLSIARGSNAELQTQIMLCNNLGFIEDNECNELLELSYEIAKMLNSMIDKLK